MKAKDYIDKEVKVYSRKWQGDKQVVTTQVMLSRAKVIEVEKNSRTMLIVKDIDRGPGWCDTKKTYIGVKVANGWFLGKNNDYQEGSYKVHINQLELLTENV